MGIFDYFFFFKLVGNFYGANDSIEYKQLIVLSGRLLLALRHTLHPDLLESPSLVDRSSAIFSRKNSRGLKVTFLFGPILDDWLKEKNHETLKGCPQ